MKLKKKKKKEEQKRDNVLNEMIRCALWIA